MMAVKAAPVHLGTMQRADHQENSFQHHSQVSSRKNLSFSINSILSSSNGSDTEPDLNGSEVKEAEMESDMEAGSNSDDQLGMTKKFKAI